MLFGLTGTNMQNTVPHLYVHPEENIWHSPFLPTHKRFMLSTNGSHGGALMKEMPASEVLTATQKMPVGGSNNHKAWIKAMKAHHTLRHQLAKVFEKVDTGEGSKAKPCLGARTKTFRTYKRKHVFMLLVVCKRP
jgi:hypothetical protein